MHWVIALAIAAQAVPAEVVRERTEWTGWLRDAPASPYRAVVQHPVGAGIVLGPPDADVPLTGLGRFQLSERNGALSLSIDGATRPVGRGRLLSLGSYQILAAGPPGRTAVTVFSSDARHYAAPEYFRYAPAWRVVVSLTPVAKPIPQRILAPDGTEVEATEAGTVTVPVAGRPTRLRVFRIPAPDGEESDLEIFFRDGTSGKGSYPGGRFVTLAPSADGRYVLDFNRARNPFCGYSTVFACPAPWRGNTLTVPVAAGERYLPKT